MRRETEAVQELGSEDKGDSQDLLDHQVTLEPDRLDLPALPGPVAPLAAMASLG